MNVDLETCPCHKTLRAVAWSARLYCTARTSEAEAFCRQIKRQEEVQGTSAQATKTLMLQESLQVMQTGGCEACTPLWTGLQQFHCR